MVFYDPLGLGAPFTLEERQIVKKLRQKKLQYIEKKKNDERSPYKRLKWKDNLLTMENVRVYHYATS